MTRPLLVPGSDRLRDDVRLEELRLAVGKALVAQMDADRWREVGQLTDSEADLSAHPRVFASLYFGDEDYPGCVHDVVPAVLGLRVQHVGHATNGTHTTTTELLHWGLLEDYLQLPGWLEGNDPWLYRRLYAGNPAEGLALDAVHMGAANLPEVARHLERLARDLGGDLPAAVGHTKDLVETACKTVLGQTGPGAGADGPTLVAAALRAVGRHPQDSAADPDARLVRTVLGATSNQLNAIFELRNRVGTGHGRAGEVPLDEPLTRLVVGQALHAVAYLLAVHDQQTATGTT